MTEFESKNVEFQNAKWGSYIILPLCVKDDELSAQLRKEKFKALLENSQATGDNIRREKIATDDLSDILTSRCEQNGDFVDQYEINYKLGKLFFNENEYIEPRDIHLYYFQDGGLAFLTILLVNESLTINNFYEFINPGYLLDYDQVDGLRGAFLKEVQDKIIDGILKECSFEIYVKNPEKFALKESYWLNATFVKTRFDELETLKRLTYNAHRLIPIAEDFTDTSEKDISYSFGARDVKEKNYGWGCCISSQSISYVYGSKPKIKADEVISELAAGDIFTQVKSDLLLTVIALSQKYTCIKLNNMIYDKIKCDGNREENIHEIKNNVLKTRAYETYTSSQISRWNNVCETYRLLLEMNGVNEYMHDIEDKINLLDEELDRVSAERDKQTADRESKIMNIIALFGSLSIIVSVLDIMDYIKGSPVDMVIACVITTAVVAFVIAWILKRGNKKDRGGDEDEKK